MDEDMRNATANLSSMRSLIEDKQFSVFGNDLAEDRFWSFTIDNAFTYWTGPFEPNLAPSMDFHDDLQEF